MCHGVLWKSFFNLRDSCVIVSSPAVMMPFMSLNKAICISTQQSAVRHTNWGLGLDALRTGMVQSKMQSWMGTKVGICHNHFHRIESNHSNITCPSHISTPWLGGIQCYIMEIKLSYLKNLSNFIFLHLSHPTVAWIANLWTEWKTFPFM